MIWPNSSSSVSCPEVIFNRLIFYRNCMLFVFSHFSRKILGERLLESMFGLSSLPDTTTTVYMADFSMRDPTCDFVFIFGWALFTTLFVFLMWCECWQHHHSQAIVCVCGTHGYPVQRQESSLTLLPLSSGREEDLIMADVGCRGADNIGSHK